MIKSQSKELYLGDVLETFDKRLGNKPEPTILTLTEGNGFVSQIDRFNKRLARKNTSDYKLIGKYDVAFNPYLLWAGAIAQNTKWNSAIISPVYPTFKVRSGFDPRFVNYILHSESMKLRYDKISFGTVPRRRRASVDNFLDINIQSPPSLIEQKRIAAILDQADAIRRKRQQAIQLADDFLRATFLDMFGDPVRNPKGYNETNLIEIADIVSGVTKGRKFNGKKTVNVPYMRVANIQDGHIDLSDVKEIEALETDIKKYSLCYGDILLTEGGDPDKLGRGAVWREEVKSCIHQNHIFRVRLDKSKVLPEYLSALIGSIRGKRYFLRAAKQTTGIASINMTQLKGFPALLPPLNAQKKYVSFIEKHERYLMSLKNLLDLNNNLFNSLTQRAFRGEL